MSSLRTKGQTALALGLRNIARVTAYRLALRLRLHALTRRQHQPIPEAPFYLPTDAGACVAAPKAGWTDTGVLFSHIPVALNGRSPDWFVNPLTGARMLGPERDWWEIPDYDPAVGDIKLFWELSRMDWVIALAQQARCGEDAALARLNHWLSDWCEHNAPYRGPNWKCGQEASIRVIHLAAGGLILKPLGRQPKGLRDLIALHLRRIAPTIQYAMGQDNNHGTSEAAALFIGGSWLRLFGDGASGEVAGWERIGRHWLEECARRLIDSNGTFSQYSLNYHRLMLDTFSFVEVWRLRMGLPPFSATWQARARAAAEWLRHLISAETGDGPNVGANDGARLLQLTNTDYRDFRPSVQVGMALFAQQVAYEGSGAWNCALEWLEIPRPAQVASPPRHFIADGGGFAVLRRGNAMALLRYPRFRFRPSHADVLHVDLWLAGENILRDGGTYSYNTDGPWVEYFSGTRSHNTIQFDGREQMPRLSRFLMGDWLRTCWKQDLEEDALGARYGAGYCDGQGATHRRTVELSEKSMVVNDVVMGFARKAVLRWRLPPGQWHVHSTDTSLELTNDAWPGRRMRVESSAPLQRCELVEGWESRYYLKRTPIPVLEVEIGSAGSLRSSFFWSS